MEEKSSNSNNKYAVGELYKSAWSVIKKNLKELALITLVGVFVSVAISVIATVIVDSLVDTTSGGFVAIGLGSAITVLASIYVAVLQVVALKKATDGQKLVLKDVLNESLKYVPRSLAYGLFIVAVIVGATALIGLTAVTIGFISFFLSIAAVVLLIIALFKFAFLQFLIVEPKETAFLDRFKISSKLTEGFYGKLFSLWLVAILLGICGGIIASVVSALFKPEVEINFTNNSLTTQSSQEDFLDTVNSATVEKDNVDANFVIYRFIQEAISWGVGLVIMGALLEMYTRRKTDTKMN